VKPGSRSQKEVAVAAAAFCVRKCVSAWEMVKAMMGLRGAAAAVIVASLSCAACNSADAGINSLPRVVAAIVPAATLESHHTEWFELERGAALRRGQVIQLQVELQEPLEEGVKIKVGNDQRPDLVRFDTISVKPVQGQEKKLAVEVITPVDSPIAKLDNLTVWTERGGNRGPTFTLDGPLYLLYNPWLKEDHEVYLPTEEMRKEHILHQVGNVYQGTVSAMEIGQFYYGQASQVTLDAAFYLLNRLPDPALASNVILVLQTLSQHQGMTRYANRSVWAGDEDALLEGNWGIFPFTEKDAPELWTSVTDILNKWQKTRKPVQYGQCWVFGAVLNSMVRAIGVGGRQVTAFGSFADASNRRGPDHRLHHVADTFYDINGTTIYTESPAWNFHSWADVWLNRDQDKYSGWHTLDGTPPGKIGPASVKATRNLDESYGYNNTDVISTVHSTARSFLVNCTKEHRPNHKLEHCTVERLMKYDSKGLPLVVSSKTEPNGTMTMLNITTDYIDRSKDAYIPWNHTSDTRRLLRGDTTEQLRGAENEALTIVPESFSVIVGSPISGVIDLKTEKFQQGEHVQMNVMFTLETYRGHEIKQLQSVSQRVLIKGSMVSLPYFLDAATYLQPDLGDVFIKIVVTGVSDHGEYVFALEKLDIGSPPLFLKAPPQVEVAASEEERGSFPVSVSFRNPLQFALQNVTLTIHSHQLEFADMSEKATSVSKSMPLGVGKEIRLQTSILTPTKPGVNYILASLSGDYLAYSQANSMVIAVSTSSATPGKPFQHTEEIIFDAATASTFQTLEIA